MRIRVAAVVVVVLASLACGGIDGGSESACAAAGIYTVCTTSGGYRSCVDQGSEGMGVGPDAATDALAMCTEHMTNMIIISNMNGEASVKQTCQVVACEG